MIGDLPDAECAPPENVLFVCKLNPVTSDEDLEVIFARFGKVVSCEVIRDRKSGDSLQYAFVEFDSPEACERAYFKMDNVLIDDRRIHVDFSQSVSKFQWKGKGRLTVNKDGYDGMGKRGSKPQGQGQRRERSPQSRKRSPSPPRRRRSRSRDRNRKRSRTPEKKHKRRERSKSRSPSRKHKRRDRSRSKERKRSRSREDSRRRRSRSRDRERHRKRSRDRR